MAPYKFKYYQHVGVDIAEHVSPVGAAPLRTTRRHGRQSREEYGRRYDEEPGDADYSETGVTSRTPGRTTPSIFRSVTPKPRDAHKRRRRGQQPGQYDHHLAHIHYISPRSEPPVKYGSSPRTHGLQQEMVVLKTRARSETEPRITLLANRKPKRKRRSYSDDHACPEKSSKAIPSMYYDELRCPHCAAHVQPAQDEVMAYRGQSRATGPVDTTTTSPRNAGRAQQTFCPTSGAFTRAQRAPRSGYKNPPASAGATHHDPVQKARSVGDFTDYAQLSRRPGLRGTSLNRGEPPVNRDLAPPLARHPLSTTLNGQAFSQNRGQWDEAAALSAVTPVKPMFRPDNAAPNRSEFRTDDVSNRPYLAQNLAKYDTRRYDGDMSTVREDDITPFDSVSNIMPLPPLRATDRESIVNRLTRTRIETGVDHSYTKENFFQSLVGPDGVAAQEKWVCLHRGPRKTRPARFPGC
ncbi:hypothetical protein Btru_002593 [Bulinus truncatus]|nr:hypothetical protein Btru_002593 [Bulinus truncatus]